MDYIQSQLGIDGGDEVVVQKKERNSRTKGYVCPQCGSYVKEYRRTFNSNMAVALLMLWKHKVNGFVKVEDFLLQHGLKRCGDFSYLVHYRFLEKQEGKRLDDSKRNGYYRLTSFGIMFCEMKSKCKEKFIIFHNKLLGFEGKEITIKDALGTKFDYSKLMSNE